MGCVHSGAVVVDAGFGVEAAGGEEVDIADGAGGQAGGTAISVILIYGGVAEDGVLVGFDGLAVFVGQCDHRAEAVEVVIVAGGVLQDDVPVAGEDVGVDIVDDAVVVEVGVGVEITVAVL